MSAAAGAYDIPLSQPYQISDQLHSLASLERGLNG